MNRTHVTFGLALLVASPALAGQTGNGWSQSQTSSVQQAPLSDAGMGQMNRDDHDSDRTGNGPEHRVAESAWSGHQSHCRTTWRHHHRVRTCG